MLVPIQRMAGGPSILEHLFESNGPRSRRRPRTRFPSERTASVKQPLPSRRLTGMHAPMHGPTRQIAISAVRTAFLVAVAMLLILGLLPAVLAVQAATM